MRRQIRSRAPLLGAGCYLLFIVYGSLVPLDFHPRPLAAAWRDFLDIRYLVLGVGSRADWVANLLLYMPMAYLLSAVAAAQSSLARRLLSASIVFFACSALAVGVEFTQLFFPARTVSINDIGAEIVGAALGIAVWHVWGDTLTRLWREMENGGIVAIRAAAILYALTYLTLSLFPFDFYVSAEEFSQKFASGAYGLFMAPASCGRLSICMGKLGAETFVVIPLGIFLSMVLGKTASRAYGKAAWCGLALGLVIETAQLFIVSGVSQGVSLLTRAVGMLLGVALHRLVRLQWLHAAQPLMRPAVLVASLPYFFALILYNGLFRSGWASLDEARENLSQINWLPFYYHYFTTETGALVSLLANVAMYVPVGIGCWLWKWGRLGRSESASIALPAGIATVLAVMIEAGKLFVGKGPDPTDVLIGAASAALAYRIMQLLYQWSAGIQSAPAVIDERRTEPHLPIAYRYGIAPAFAALLLLAAVGIAVANYPLSKPWLLVALTGYGCLIWRMPSIALPAVLAMLPLLNLGQWTGWVLVSEFDLVMGVTIAVLLMRWRPQTDKSQPAYRMSRMVVPLAASFLISAVIGLFPLQAFDYNAISGYWSGYNSLRTLKGFLWAWALLPLAARHSGSPARFEASIVTGVAIGLGVEAVMVAWERLVFTGLFEFSHDYRAMGTFPELHTGGGDIHAYLVLGIPFAAAWILLRPGIVRVAVGTALFALASYALAVTFTRGGYVGYFGALLVLGIALTIHEVRQRAWKVKRIAIAGITAAAGLAVMAPILIGPFMQSRVAGAHGEADVRMRHWARAIDMMDRQLSTTFFGMGLGSFPRTFLIAARDDATATFSYMHDDDGNRFVRLGSGKPLYFGQRVSIEAGKNYTLAVDLRSSSPNAQLGGAICEKSEQNSFECKSMGFQIAQSGTTWQRQEAKFNSDDVGRALGRLHLRRPVYLTLINSAQGSVIDLDNVRLLDENSRELIVNGDFSHGSARWFFAADDHAPWHIFNLWVEILFEQGWFGLFAFTIVVAVALARLARRMWRGDAIGGALLAAICGFLLIGVTESLFDGPRVTTLFFLLLFAGLRRT